MSEARPSVSPTLAHWWCALSKCAWQTPRAGPSPARHTDPFRVHPGYDKIWDWPTFLTSPFVLLFNYPWFFLKPLLQFSVMEDAPCRTCQNLENSWCRHPGDVINRLILRFKARYCWVLPSRGSPVWTGRHRKPPSPRLSGWASPPCSPVHPAVPPGGVGAWARS